MRIIVSACLLGDDCKYNGGNNLNVKLKELLERGGHEIIAMCPEVLGGLPVPREPAEICDGVVMTGEGVSVDSEFRKGADVAVRMAIAEKADLAILQSRSPSCGVGVIYDGTFTGTKTIGNGVFAALLQKNAIPAVDVEDFLEKPERFIV